MRSHSSAAVCGTSDIPQFLPDKARPVQSGARSRAPGKTPETESPDGQSKRALIVALLRRKKGATVRELEEATGWQAHSIRGLISAVIRRKLNLNVETEHAPDGRLRYRITKAARV